MDEQLPSKSFSLTQKVLIGFLLSFFLISFLLVLILWINYFGLYNLSDKVSFFRFLPTRRGPLIREVNDMINLIQNPNPQLIAKYNISKEQITDEQTLILCGGYPESNRIRIVYLDENKCLPDSLIGIRKALKAKDYTSARTLIKTMYRRVTNPNFRDDVLVRLSPEEALKLDPEKQFLAFPPSGQPAFLYSEVKGQETASKMIKLFYSLKRK